MTASTVCRREMQSHQANGEAYYRCRYAQESALANKIHHPRNVYLRQRDLVGPLDAALARAFAPHRLTDTSPSWPTARTTPTMSPVPAPRWPRATPNSPATGPRRKLAPTRTWSPGGSRRSKPNVAAFWPCSTSLNPDRSNA